MRERWGVREVKYLFRHRRRNILYSSPVILKREMHAFPCQAIFSQGFFGYTPVWVHTHPAVSTEELRTDQTPVQEKSLLASNSPIFKVNGGLVTSHSVKRHWLFGRSCQNKERNYFVIYKVAKCDFSPTGKKKRVFQHENQQKRLQKNQHYGRKPFLMKMLFVVICLVYKHFKIRIYIVTENAYKYYINFLSHY